MMMGFDGNLLYFSVFQPSVVAKGEGGTLDSSSHKQTQKGRNSPVAILSLDVLLTVK